MEWSAYDGRGRRKYLLSIERERFLQRALNEGGKTATFCAVLALSGARISEVLAITPERIDLTNCTISFETLKRRKRGIFRVIPVPPELIVFLDAVHQLGAAQDDSKSASRRLWSWSRSTAWRRVKAVMKLAMVPAFVSQPKALRHALGVEAAQKGVVITLIKDVLGHADVRTTLVYTTVVGAEARSMLERTWLPLGDLQSPGDSRATIASDSSAAELVSAQSERIPAFVAATHSTARIGKIPG